MAATKWEHYVISEDWELDSRQLMERLDQAGEDGWELVAVVHNRSVNRIVHYFKRPKVTPGTEPRFRTLG